MVLIGAAVVLIAVAVGWIGFRLVAIDTDTAVTARRLHVAEPSPTSMVPSPTSTPDVVIAASAPLRLQVPVIGLDGAVSEYTQAMIDNRGGYEPPELSSISWDTTILGGLAGTDSMNTLYLYGHSWTEPAVFNGLKDLHVGDVASISTANGKLCYVAQKTLKLNKSEYKSNEELTNSISNRLVLVSCYRPVGYDPNSATVQNVVVILQLDQERTNNGC